MTDTYSALRDSLLTPLQEKTGVPIEPSPEDQETIDLMAKLNMTNQLYALVFPLPLRLKFDKLLDRMFKSSPTGKIDGRCNFDTDAIIWTITNGLVDKLLLPLFSESDVVSFSGKYEEFVIFLVWEIWKANGVMTDETRKLVGNSEGTVQSSDSSGLQAINEEQ